MTRTRNFTFIVYPDSAPASWLSLLDDFHVPCLISPLHDSDTVSDVDLSPKKPHYHVILMFDSVKTLDQAKEISSVCGAANDVVFPVQSLRGSARYLCHLDNPNKFQYSVDGVVCLGGVNYLDIIELPSSRYSVINEMMDFVQSEHITSLAELCEVARVNREDWFRILCDSGCYIMREYIKSNYWVSNQQ